MAKKQTIADIGGCLVMLVNGVIGVTGAFWIARWAAPNFGNWYWVGGIAVFFAASTALSAIGWGVFCAILFLFDKVFSLDRLLSEVSSEDADDDETGDDTP